MFLRRYFHTELKIVLSLQMFGPYNYDVVIFGPPTHLWHESMLALISQQSVVEVSSHF